MTGRTYAALIMMLFLKNPKFKDNMKSTIVHTDKLAETLNITIDISLQTKYNTINELIASGLLICKKDKYNAKLIFISK